MGFTNSPASLGEVTLAAGSEVGVTGVASTVGITGPVSVPDAIPSTLPPAGSPGSFAVRLVSGSNLAVASVGAGVATTIVPALGGVQYELHSCLFSDLSSSATWNITMTDTLGSLFFQAGDSSLGSTPPFPHDFEGFTLAISRGVQVQLSGTGVVLVNLVYCELS